MYSRLFILLLLLVPSYSLEAQTVEAAKDCSLRSLQICALHVAQDEAGIVTAPLHLNASSLLWIAPFGAATGFAIDKDAEAIRSLGEQVK